MCVDEDAALTVWKYLRSPAPILETVRLRSHPWSGDRSEGLELLGGKTHNIRQLHLSGYIVKWDLCAFRGLKHLRLAYADRYRLTMDVILGILADSPDLEDLYVHSMNFPVSTAPSLYPIHLPHLRTIELADLPVNVAFPLLCHIKAPHCQSIRIEAKSYQNNN